VTSLNVNEGLGSHASVAVGVVKAGVAGHSTDDGPGKPEITGAVLSVTEMVWEAWEELLQSSVAVQERVTLYSCGQAPGVVTSLNVNEGLGSHASVAIGVVNTGVAGHSTDDGPGKAEITEMVWEAWEELLQ
jgi:acyl-CoA-binding protein